MQQDVDQFVEALSNVLRISIELPFFQYNGGKLYIVLQICAVFLIMCHKQVVFKYDRHNAVAKVVIAAANIEKINDSRWPDAAHERSLIIGVINYGQL